MKKAVALIFIALAVGCADASNQPPEVRGRGVYATYNCKRCHRIGLEGGNAGFDLTYVGFRKSAEALDVWLKDPSAWQPETLMPNFQLRDDARQALAAYLATLKGEAYRQQEPPWNTPELMADPIKRGHELYIRLGCIACHGIEGEGGKRNNNVKGGEVPELIEVGKYFTKEELVQKIRIGVRHPSKKDPNGPEPLIYMPAWGEVLEKDEMEALADYLLFLSPPEKQEDEW